VIRRLKAGGYRVESVYFEDIEIGKVDAKPQVYEVTEEEIVEFARRWDPRPFHLDESAAASSVFKGFAACSAHVFSILSWFAAQPGSKRTASLAAVAFDEVRLHHPVRPGDKLSCAFKCLEKRESATKPDRGIVRFLGELSNQAGKAAFSAVITVLVARRPL
jgi:acyl dehydratase